MPCATIDGMTDVATHLHGWGYEGHDVPDLVDHVRSVGASTVVDVRLTPLSRKYGFSKRRLEAALLEAGIGYVHLRALGNPRDNRPGFATPDSAAGRAAHARFDQEVLAGEPADEALDVLARLAEEQPVVVLCFEADQSTCHRQLVIDAVSRRRVPALV